MIVIGIVWENCIQLGQLDTADRDKHARLIEAMDGLTDRFAWNCYI